MRRLQNLKQVSIVWAKSPGSGRVNIAHGVLAGLRVTAGRGRTWSGRFEVASDGPVRLRVACRDCKLSPGSLATRLTIETRRHPFTFFLRDVNAQTPIVIPEYGVAVTVAGDRRGYAEILAAVRALGLKSELERIYGEPEETYATACAANRDQVAPTWLGLSRDMRIFQVGYSRLLGYWGYVQARYHNTPVRGHETQNQPMAVAFAIGRGAGCRAAIVRRLDDGVLPILHATQEDGDVRYELTAFATLETRPPTLRNLRGSHWLAAYFNGGCQMATPAECGQYIESLEKTEVKECAEETVCAMRIRAVNTAAFPRYAWFKAAFHTTPETMDRYPAVRPGVFDRDTGFSRFESGRVFAVNRLDGRPMPDAEVAVLIPPGGSAVFEMLISHQPLPAERAAALAKLNFKQHLAACRSFWRGKLTSAARLSLPEPAVDERVRAGLLHCDLVAFGLEPKDPVEPAIGVYTAIGSESSPIIQFFDSMGWHRLAERCLDFFLARQRPDGFIQNFGGYQLETGPVLWTMGEHYRYTRDDAWARRITPQALKACDYILAWRRRNLRDDLRGRGWGLMDGKVADPEDFFHSFMLNAVSYVGVQRVAELLARVVPAHSRRLAAEAKAFRKDIRAAFFEAMGRSPVIPTGNGDWAPTSPPWTEYPGPVSLFAEGGSWMTHGAFGGRDALIGATYLAFCEVLDPDEQAADFLLRTHQELFTLRNAGFSQPYYCRHDSLHLRRGEVKAFLKTYYNQFTALQDRQTYTFWEHFFEVSPHKTHEEGWFLMQTRWMLWLETGDTLNLLSAIPRAWLADGKRIEIERAASYFGPFSLEVESQVNRGRIVARFALDPRWRPRRLRVRLPHPEGRTAIAAIGGTYAAKAETVEIINPPAKGRVELRF